MIMNIPKNEQETSLAFYRDDKEIIVYSSDKTVITKLLKITDKVEVLTTNEAGTITSGKFTLDVSQILFRATPKKVLLSEEEKQRKADIMRANRLKSN